MDMEILGNELGRGSSYEIPKELKKKKEQVKVQI